MKETKKEDQKRKMNSRQIVAMVGVVLLVLLYVITLIAAIADSSQSARWFRICLIATFALPLVIWIYSWMYGRLTGKSAIGDPKDANSLQTASGLDNSQAPDPGQAISGGEPQKAVPGEDTSGKDGRKAVDR